MGRPPDENPSPEAERKRFLRALKKYGREPYPVFISPAMIEKLVQRGELHPNDVTDKPRVGYRFTLVLEDWLDAVAAGIWWE